ncbi:hypothetical protein BDN67DRAFT_149465 [Paxillus ammoniavirescens]|nr:hypothetical protein BDN67DRAFT_149465 [Paxillus ammoniavirescens]
MVANIPSLCPSLEFFLLTGATAEVVSLGFLDQWERLQSAICVASLTPQALKHISTCPTLRSLTFFIPDREAWVQAISLDHSSFPKLVAALVASSLLDPVSTWFQKLQLPKLETLLIATKNVAAPGSVVNLLNILQHHPLSSLSLRSPDSKELRHVSISVLRLLFN